MKVKYTCPDCGETTELEVSSSAAQQWPEVGAYYQRVAAARHICDERRGLYRRVLEKAV